MSDEVTEPTAEPTPTTPPPVEDVRRGLLFAAATIPLAGVVLAIAGALLAGYIPIYLTVVGGIAIGGVGGLLYAKGAGSAPREGRWPLVGILAAAVLLGAVCWIAGSTAQTLVGPASAFFPTLRARLFSGDGLLVVGLVLVGGVIGIVGAFRGHAIGR